MQNFKTFYKIIIQKKTFMIIYLSVFIGLSILFCTMGTDSGKNTFEKEQYKIAVFDYDETASSKAFVKYLSSIHKIVEVEDDVNVCKDKLFSRTVECVIYITEGYEESMQEGSLDGVLEYMSIPDSIYASTIISQADQYIRLLHVQLAGGSTLKDALTQVETSMEETVNIQFLDKDATSGYTAVNGSAEFSKTYYAFLYQPYVILSISISVIGMTLLVFRNPKMAARIRCSSLKFSRQNADILLAAMGAEGVLALIFIILALLIGARFLTSYHAIFYSLNVLLFSAFSLSVTFCISMIGVRAEVLNMIGTVSGLGLSFLGGIFVPMELFGDSLLKFVQLIPTYWYVNALRLLEHEAVLENSMSELLLSLGMQAGFAVAFVAIGLVIGKVKRR